LQSIEHTFVPIAEDIRRLTFPLPTPPRHVHCYLLETDAGLVLVDTGLGLPDLAERWQELLAGLDRPIVSIVITHFHPDHVGGAADAAEATGAEVFQGEDDYEECERVWGSPDWEGRIGTWFAGHGVPADVVEELGAVGAAVRPLIRYVHDPTLVRPGQTVAGWRLEAFPGHADGHLCLLKDGVMIAGDHLLPGITPAVGLYPEARPDPLGDYLQSLERTIELAPRLALPGHGELIGDPAGRARELVEHHRERLDATVAALGHRPRTAYEVSISLFGDSLPPSQRRFAVAETLAHLERLVRTDRARRSGNGRPVTYTGP
jgi:glyoxylase-like metal-dependent hydrolase (beta-lactamase superfamily II)